MVNLVQRFVSFLVAFSLTCVLFLSGTVGTTASANSITIDNLLNARPATVEEITNDMADEAQALLEAYKGLLSESNYLTNLINFDSSFISTWFYIIEDLGVLVLQPVTGVYYYFSDGVFMVDDTNYAGGGGIHSGSHNETSGGGGSRRATSEDPVMSAEDFVALIHNVNSLHVPLIHETDFKDSYQINNYPQYSVFNSSYNYYMFSSMFHICKDKILGKGYESLYVLPFIKKDDELFFTSYYIYISYELDGENTMLCMSFTDLYHPESVLSGDKLFPVSSESYYLLVGWQSSLNKIIAYRATDDNKFVAGSYSSSGDLVTFSGCTTYYSIKDDSSYDVKTLFSSLNLDGSDDIGFICSFDPFERYYIDIDTTQIPNSDLIILSGDSVYDYTITDNSDNSSTIYNFIINNYNYPSVPIDPSEPESPSNPESPSGDFTGDVNVGGNVSVSGDITVGGQVGFDVNVSPIDINFNVSGNGGSSGTSGGGEDINDYIEVDEDINTNVDDYVELIPEVSKGFIDYLKDFFAWLPKEIYGLLVLGLLVAVWCRLAGR